MTSKSLLLLQKKPNVEIIEHERRRQVEVQLLIYEEKLANMKYSPDEIARKVERVKEELLQRLRDGKPITEDGPMVETHELTAAKVREMEKISKAFGISKTHVEGAVFEKMGYEGERPEKAKEKELAKKEKEKQNGPQLSQNWLLRTYDSGSDSSSDEEANEKKATKKKRSKSPKKQIKKQKVKSRSRSRGHRKETPNGQLDRPRSRSRSKGKNRGERGHRKETPNGQLDRPRSRSRSKGKNRGESSNKGHQDSKDRATKGREPREKDKKGKDLRRELEKAESNGTKKKPKKKQSKSKSKSPPKRRK